jgi:ribosome-associated translation inhibitor RaiA
MRIDVRSAGRKRGPKGADRPSESLVAWVDRRLHFALGQFGDLVREVRVRLSDLNGSKPGRAGTPDQRVVVEVRLGRGARAGGGTLLAEVRDVDVYAGISRAADRLRRRVSAYLERSRVGERLSASGQDQSTSRSLS